MPVQREQLEADVLIVGAGPAGLACALHLANLIKKHTEAGGKPALSADNIYVLEKGREIGAHQLSGAIMNPRALAELVPDFEKSAPLDSPVTDDAALLPIAAKVQAGERLSFDDGVALYRSGDILAIGWMANAVRERMHGDIAYFNVNRHINPTNVCIASCRLCAFGRK